MKIVCVNSMEKIFPDIEPSLTLRRASVFGNERYNFQFAVCSEKDVAATFSLSVNGREIPAKLVKSMPSQLSKYLNVSDDFVIFKERASTFYPDLLLPVPDKKIYLKKDCWTSIWGTVNGAELSAGENHISISVCEDGENTYSAGFELDVLPADLPECDIPNTAWFHYDCISDYYREKVFSPRYNEILRRYFKNMTEHGINMLYVPMFSFATNTEIGKYRKTVQLVDVAYDGKKYTFGFGRLIAFMKEAESFGFRYFEMSHMATQWGAKFSPKIIADIRGKKRRIFGWDVKSTSPRYLRFLDEFLPAIVTALDENGFSGRCFFHISDEPRYEFMENYKMLSEKFRQHLKSYKIFDALSNYDFYKEGLVDFPVVSSDAVAPFFENGVPVWLYYCCSQGGEYFSNRFFNMPLLRTRILGLQLFANDIRGFLHWGYNFYYTNLSQKLIDPYFVTDAGNVYPSGDSFLVYPGAGGEPYDSVRNEAFGEAFQDYRALLLLSALRGRDFVQKLLEKEGVSGLTKYPRDEKWFAEFRERINALIMEAQCSSEAV